jgi:pectate lyase
MMNARLVLAGLALCLAQDSVSQGTVLNVRDVGAVGDGESINTAPLQRAIDSVAGRSGGTVIVPPGVFVTGTLFLKSAVTLRLENGAVLKGSRRLEDYDRGGRRLGLLFAQNEHDVTIEGDGTIDGSGDTFMDFSRAKTMSGPSVADTRQKENFRRIAAGLGDGPVWPKDRPFQMIIFSNCREVRVSHVRITNAPFWTLHFADCENVHLTSATITGNLLFPNNDGVDITSCRNVLVDDCIIETGDDAVVVTGYDHHFDLPGYQYLKHPCENVTVSNCTLVSRSSGIRVGGFDQNPMRNLVFSNITITNSNRGIGLFARDAGGIENVLFENIVIQTRLHSGDWWGNGEPIHLSAVRLTKDVPLGGIHHVQFRGILCTGESGILIYGSEESVIEDVLLENVSLEITEGPFTARAGGNFDLRPVLDPKLQLFSHDIPGIYAQFVKDLRLRDVAVRWGKVKQPFFTNALDVEHFDGLEVDGFRGGAAPPSHGATPIVLRDGSGAVLRVGSLRVERHHLLSSPGGR